jgi:short subunit dehydrogenase-like uncharacterized protein
VWRHLATSWVCGGFAIVTAESHPFEVVLFGATGFTGRRVAEYLAIHAPDLHWAIAGRSRERLMAIRSQLARHVPALESLPVIVADSTNAASIEAVAASARVVCSAVGPFAVQGLRLAGACAARGTTYCDLAGEAPFVRASIERHDALARRTGARLVHCCGFDSVPSDLGTWLVREHFKSRGHRLASAWGFVGPIRGGFSGGTVATLAMLFEAGGAATGGVEREHVHFNREMGEWAGPYLMAPVNVCIVQRSNELEDYGTGFTYREQICSGRGPSGLLKAVGRTLALKAFSAMSRSRAGRAMLRRVSPLPGEGPPTAEIDAGGFRIRVIGTSEPPEGERRIQAIATVAGSSDPGYGESVRIIGESIVCLARDRLPATCGVLTPTAAMGARLAGRLQRAGMTVSVEDWTPASDTRAPGDSRARV